MSQTAVLGIDRNGNVSVHHSDARSWAVTVAGEVTSKFDFFEAFSGPFLPNERVEALCRSRIVNNGSVKGEVYATFAELDVDGMVITELCRLSTSPEAGAYCDLDRHYGWPPVENQWNCSFALCTPTYVGNCGVDVPNTPGEYYYGIKTWGESELEPDYPAITGLALGLDGVENNMLPVAVTAGSLGALAAVIGYNAVKRRY